MFRIVKKFLGSLVLVLLFTNVLEAKNISFSKDLGIGVKARVSSVSHKKKNIVSKKLRLKTGILLGMEK